MSKQQENVSSFLGLNQTVLDCLFLSLVVLLSCIIYIWKLGFYSDDWGFLINFVNAEDKSLFGITKAFYIADPNARMRPVQLFYLSALYWLFGLNPLGYHIVNSAVLLLGTLVFYLVLRELGQPRLITLAVPLVYILLPHYATDRFWFAAFQAGLSMTLYFVSLYSDLKALKAKSASFWGWQSLGILSLIASNLAYEVFLPLFFLNPLLVWYRAKQLENVEQTQKLTRAKLPFLYGRNVLAIIPVILFKLLTTSRLSTKTMLMEQFTGGKIPPVYMSLFVFVASGLIGLGIWAYFYRKRRPTKEVKFKIQLPTLNKKSKLILLGLIVVVIGSTIVLTNFYLKSNPTSVIARATGWWMQLITKTVSVSYGDYGIGLPRIVWKIFQDYPNGAIFAVTALLGGIIFTYLFNITNRFQAEQLNRDNLFWLIVYGIIIFALGYAIFLSNRSIVITTSGLGNRVAIAASVGVALFFVGAIGWVSTFLLSNYQRQTFLCLLITLLCMSGFLINNTIATFWIDSYQKQQEVLADIRQWVPTIPTGSTFMLDGVCPHIGPVPVFEANLDLVPALRLLYSDRTLKADVVKPRMKVTEDGLLTRFYGVESLYPYRQLLVYNFNTKKTYQLTDAKTAKDYFQNLHPNRNNSCPRSYEGYGVLIF